MRVNDNEHTIAIKKHFCSFSEAIREGARVRPQGFGELHKDGKSCAIGAGREAIYGTTESDQQHYDQVRVLFPYLRTRVNCPAGCFVKSTLFIVTYHLNDDHRWAREAIADWLELEEEKLGFVTVVDSESSRSQTEAVSEMVMV